VLISALSRPTPYALRPTPYALRPTPYALSLTYTPHTQSLSVNYTLHPTLSPSRTHTLSLSLSVKQKTRGDRALSCHSSGSWSRPGMWTLIGVYKDISPPSPRDTIGSAERQRERERERERVCVCVCLLDKAVSLCV